MEMRQIIKLTALLCLAMGPFLLAAQYRFETINFPSSVETQANGINARGDIVGIYIDAENVSHSFLLHKGIFTTIEVPFATETLAARGINARGDIVGNFHDSTFTRHGYLLSNGQFTQIDYPGASVTILERINNAGDITGTWFDDRGNVSAFIRRDGKFQNVSIPNGSNENVRSAQDNGRVLVGSVILNVDGGYRGFISRDPGKFELIEYPGLAVPCSGLRSINQRGDIVGAFGYVNVVDECYPPFDDQHGFLLRDGQFTLIEFPGSPSTDAMCINDDGVIVGRYTDRNGSFRGFKAVPSE
jgi:probable HAF family extracellular repeat protein